MLEVTSRPASPQHGQDSREGQVEDQLFALARGVCSEERPHFSCVGSSMLSTMNKHCKALKAQQRAQHRCPNRAILQCSSSFQHMNLFVQVSEESLELEAMFTCRDCLACPRSQIALGMTGIRTQRQEFDKNLG